MKKDELIKGSLTLFVMLIIFNLLNYVFQISMARMLGPADYGVLAVLMSIIYIFGIPSEAIQTVITKYTSKFNIKKDFGKMKYTAYKSLKRGVLFSTLIFLVFLPIAFFLSVYLKINFLLIALTGLFIFYVFSIPIIRGLIQGRKKFMALGLNMTIESLVKVILAVVFVFAGWKVYGAIIGLLIAEALAFIFAFFCIEEILSSKRKNENFGRIYSSNLPILIAITSVVLMYSLDIILARRFFSPELAGKYAFVSMIGKTILFVSLGITKAMFPISSEKFENRRKTFDLFKKSIVLVLIISGIALLFCLFLPTFVIKIVSLGSSQYIEASNILFIIGLTFSMISISNVIIIYNLSINKIGKSSYFLLLFVLIEVVLLSIFNSGLVEFSLALLTVGFLMFLYSLWLIKK